MIFVGMSFGFISAIGAFPTSKTAPFNTTGTDITIVENLTQNVTGEVGHLSLSSMWAIATGIGVAGSVIVGILMHSTTLIGISLFGTFFWSSWISIVNLFYTFDFLETGAGLILVTMISIGMIFMFIGAVIGMLSGSHWSR